MWTTSAYYQSIIKRVIITKIFISQLPHPNSHQEVARSTIHRILDKQEIDFTGKDCSVRFNSADSGLCEPDMEEVLSAGHLPTTVHLPKVESPEQLEWVGVDLRYFPAILWFSFIFMIF